MCFSLINKYRDKIHNCTLSLASIEDRKEKNLDHFLGNSLLEYNSVLIFKNVDEYSCNTPKLKDEYSSKHRGIKYSEIRLDV